MKVFVGAYVMCIYVGLLCRYVYMKNVSCVYTPVNQSGLRYQNRYRLKPTHTQKF